DGRYLLQIAQDGEQAVQLARRDMPDLILLDINMPKRDGYSVCAALKSDPATASVKVVMLTALSQAEDRQRAFAAGADGYITKPFAIETLREKVQNLLGLAG
ncbi:MAG: response regulator, partial [Chloroflexota bacterium]|nr:response regulator [Chloroflexota bacterium]